MALDFPDNPTDQQVYGDYIYDAASTGWRSAVMVGAAPCGSIMPFAGANIPAGWLLCDGAAVSRTTYSSLFAALGGINSPWGLGNGSTTFNLPDLRKRVPVGKGASGTLSTLGAVGGAETMTLEEAHLAAHTHSFSATTSAVGNHQHAPPVAVSYGGSAGNYRNLLTTNTPLWSGADWNCAVSPGGAHDHTVSGTTGSKGSGSAFGLLQPYAIVNYIIKFAAVVAATDTELAVRMGEAEAAANAATAAVSSKANLSGANFTGTVTSAGNPKFYANGNAITGTTSITKYIFPVVRVNVANGYNSTTGNFTAPVAGTYMFDAQFQKRSGSAMEIYFYKNGSAFQGRSVYNDLGGDSPAPRANVIVTLAANDYVSVHITRSGGDVYATASEAFTWFSGYLIG